ncbi:MAG: hypothetical protein IPI79_12235 [Moraxellaceae bacterium]|nr:hypothetical protein [Moraxellaceae bacterium]
MALAGQERRRGQLRELYLEDIAQGTQLIHCQGEVIGQVNALTVIHYADSEFGLPSRITATVHQGGGDVLDIERTVDLGGSLHAKGVLLLSSYLKPSLAEINLALFGQYCHGTKLWWCRR